MIARAPRTILLASLLLPACFDDSRGDTGSATTADPTTGAATTASTDGTTSTTTGSTTADLTTGAPTTSTSSGGPTSTTDEPGTTGTTGDTDAGCSMYCAAMMGSCLGEHGQYPSLDSCLGACAGLPPGSPGETSGNSLACRAYHAGMASIDPATHCVHAGPGGAEACGQNCEGFCAIATSICPDEHPSLADCQALCSTLADTEPYDTADASGDTLACRLYHLTVAATSPADAVIHCAHTLAASPPCM